MTLGDLTKAPIPLLIMTRYRPMAYTRALPERTVAYQRNQASGSTCLTSPRPPQTPGSLSVAVLLVNVNPETIFLVLLHSSSPVLADPLFGVMPCLAGELYWAGLCCAMAFCILSTPKATTAVEAISTVNCDQALATALQAS